MVREMKAFSHAHVHVAGALLALMVGTAISWSVWLWWPSKPVVEFADFVLVNPRVLGPGDELALTYSVTRNESCTITIVPRFFDRDNNAFDSDVFRSSLTTENVVSDETILPLTITLPENIHAGSWYYWPIVRPGENCRNRTAVNAPRAEFTVTETGFCRGIRGSANMYFHEPGSAYYSRVTSPIACFESVEEAEAAGFSRPAN